MKDFSQRTKSYVINLEKNSDRLAKFMNYYNSSDINVIDIQRFNAINGRQIDISQYVTSAAYKQIIDAEINGYRLRHYELTRGAVGCFLSHTALYNRLLVDNSKEFYLIFEDDAKIPVKCLEKVKMYIDKVPDDWDILLFGVIRKTVSTQNDLFDKIKVWWGLCGYVINKKGAKKIMDYLHENNKIDKQIDSLLSLMVIEGKLNVYSTRERVIQHNTENTGTDIQLPVKVATNIDPFKYEDTSL